MLFNILNCEQSTNPPVDLTPVEFLVGTLILEFTHVLDLLNVLVIDTLSLLLPHLIEVGLLRCDSLR